MASDTASVPETGHGTKEHQPSKWRELWTTLSELPRKILSKLFLPYHVVLMIFIFISWILLSVLLAGSCPHATSALANVYLISVSYTSNTDSIETNTENSNITSLISGAVQDAHLTVRTGYFGICAKSGTQVAWTCRNGRDNLAKAMGDSLQDPLGLLDISANFRDHAVSPGLILAALAISIFVFLELGTFPGWRVEINEEDDEEIEVKPFPSTAGAQACFIASSFSVSLLLMSGLWQNVAAAAAGSTISYTTYGVTKAHIGPVAMVLIWLAFLASFLVTVGLLVLILSIRVLNSLTDDNTDDEDEESLLSDVHGERQARSSDDENMHD